MKYLKSTLSLLTIGLLSFGLISCKDETKEKSAAEPTSNEIHQGLNSKESKESGKKTQGNPSDAVVAIYLEVKNALVEDDQEAAAEAGGKMVKTLEEFDKSSYASEEQKELEDIIIDAKEHAEHISESPIDHQREHFDILSKDVIDLIGITGTNKKLYQAFCPMYNDNKGAQWVSATKEIKNPYMGAKMMKCGEVQKEFN